MTVESIVKVGVEDSGFKRFAELFDKYQAQLAKTPNAWKAIGKESAAAATQFERMAAALMAQNQLSHENDEEEEKRHKRLGDSEKLWTSMSRSAKSMAKSVLDIGTGVLKWGSIIGGIATGASLFGIDRMAQGVAGSRRSAMGMGLSIGEQKAFDIDFGRVADPSFMAMVNEMKSDPAKGTALSIFGINPALSTADAAVQLLDKLRAQARATDPSLRGTLDRQNSLNLGTEFYGRIANTQDPEWGSVKAGYLRDAKSFDPGKETALAWQNFVTQIERAAVQIENIFVKKLTPLAGPLERLSAAFIEFLGKITEKNGIVEEGINKVAGWLDSFSGTLSKPEFLAKVEQFTSDVGGLADAVHTVVEATNHPGAAAGKAVWGMLKADFVDSHVAQWEAIKELAATGAGGARVAFLEEKYGLPKGSFASVGLKESASSLDAPDQPDANGAGGPFQIKPSMGNGIDRHNFDAASARAADIIGQELQRFSGDIVKQITGYQLSNPTLNALLAANMNNGQQVPYLQGITVRVDNRSATDITVTAAALAPGP
jgi:hypothetical protein